MRFQLTQGSAMDDLLDLPWHLPLTAWDRRLTVDGPRGARSDRCSVEVDGAVVDLRELPTADAVRSHQALRALRHEGATVVEAIGVVSDRTDRDGGALPSVLLTRRPEHALRHELLLTADVPDERDDVVGAAVQLLVELHLLGFVWHDASLARMRFRHDAGRLSACLVEVGRGELREHLSAGDRLRDLEAATGRIAEELLAARAVPPGPEGDPTGRIHEVRHEIRGRYRRLWHELTREERFEVGDRARGEARLRRVNELGFDVEEITVTGEEGPRVRLGPAVLEPGHHRRLLRRLTRLDVQENQARRLLEDVDRFRASLATPDAGAAPERDAAVAKRWLHEVFRPTVAAVPTRLRRPAQDDAEVFHEILEHRYYLSERAGHDVGTQAAVDAYVSDVLAAHPERRTAG